MSVCNFALSLGPTFTRYVGMILINKESMEVRAVRIRSVCMSYKNCLDGFTAISCEEDARIHERIGILIKNY